MTRQNIILATEFDKSTARCFLACCYDDTLRLPNKEKMDRLIQLGWVERLPIGAYAETSMLRSVDLY